MTSKHTPGPWHLLKERGCAFQIGDDADSDNATILATRFEWRDRADEMLANGRLMAAAPDLLAAALDAVIRIRSALILLKCDEDFIDSEVASLRAAIAKTAGSAS